jgi:hypothetical protein
MKIKRGNSPRLWFVVQADWDANAARIAPNCRGHISVVGARLRTHIGQLRPKTEFVHWITSIERPAELLPQQTADASVRLGLKTKHLSSFSSSF